MELLLPPFQAYRGSEPPRFASPAELECAKVLDYYGVAWEYEPRTFVLERDEAGRVIEAFTPDFYLCEQDLYVEITRRWLELSEAGKPAGPDSALESLLAADVRRWWQRRRSLKLGR